MTNHHSRQTVLTVLTACRRVVDMTTRPAFTPEVLMLNPSHRHEVSYKRVIVSGWSSKHNTLATWGTCSCGTDLIRYDVDGLPSIRQPCPWLSAADAGPLGPTEGPESSGTAESVTSS